MPIPDFSLRTHRRVVDIRDTPHGDKRLIITKDDLQRLDTRLKWVFRLMVLAMSLAFGGLFVVLYIILEKVL